LTSYQIPSILSAGSADYIIRRADGEVDPDSEAHFGDWVLASSNTVPEPATLTLLAAGLLAGVAFRKRFS